LEAEASARGFERLLDALQRAGYDPSTERFGEDWLLRLPGDPFRWTYRLRIFGLHGAAGEEGWGSLNTWVPRRKDPARRPASVRWLTLGYTADLDLFAGWPAYDAAPDWNRVLFPVPRRALREAERTGWSEPLTTSAAYVFSPDRVAAFMTLHGSSQWEQDLVIKAPRTRGGRLFRRAFGSPREILYEGEAFDARLPIEFEEVEPEEAEAEVVETGLASAEKAEPLPVASALRAGAEYLYWFAIGAQTGASAETTPVAPPADLPEGAILTVQLFPFEGEIELIGPTQGELRLLADGSAAVETPAAAPEHGRWTERLLFFPVRAPAAPGSHRLRANLYYRGTLVQSRVMYCQVGDELNQGEETFRSELDYSLTEVVDAERLDQMPGHDFSLLINGDELPAPAPTHQIRFFGGTEGPFTGTASLGEKQIERAIKSIRGALRRASWSSEAKFGPDDEQRYGEEGDLTRLREDLIRLAVRGGDLYLSITGRLSQPRNHLERQMRRPGRIQISSTDPALYLPAGLFYDHPVEPMPGSETTGKYELCSEFLGALDGEAPIEDCRCIAGDCPSYEDELVVCPSGFWGYRHQIGWLPQTIEAVTKVPANSKAEMVIGISTDKELGQRDAHIEEILKMGKGKVARTRERFRELAREGNPQLVYLYCHGGVGTGSGTPFLEIGNPQSDGITSSYLARQRIQWGPPPHQPLVFINGCETVALEPESLSDLVGGFVREARAVGVVGSEVTIFESLACNFAQSALKGFLDGSMTIGESVRRARFDLLRKRNPLGLVYVPFVAADTRLTRT